MIGLKSLYREVLQYKRFCDVLEDNTADDRKLSNVLGTVIDCVRKMFTKETIFKWEEGLDLQPLNQTEA